MFCFPGKVLIIGGGIANFTNVAATFKVQCTCTLVMFFDMYTCVCVHVDCSFSFDVYISGVCVHVYVCMYMYTCICMHVCMSAYACVYVRICVHVCVCV